jgi:hypothetical protein
VCRSRVSGLKQSLCYVQKSVLYAEEVKLKLFADFTQVLFPDFCGVNLAEFYAMQHFADFLTSALTFQTF